ncbi:hypothetical protein EG68_08277 [Paragonimus skrjabini miyazakii]|uniref:Uncharacterized protein n=1 Tax=Paragonimus skrjabini miyazakii TaxID=59628 RepID=A0A8S9YP76_9TREM|nr:hypothetical protein EG68_08277 [Paragonimus skrjabini miyazakii]
MFMDRNSLSSLQLPKIYRLWKGFTSISTVYGRRIDSCKTVCTVNIHLRRTGTRQSSRHDRALSTASYRGVETLEQATQTLDVPVNMLEQYRIENEALR